jgi:hypothetical protein
LLTELPDRIAPTASFALFPIMMERELPNRFEIIFSTIEKVTQKNSYPYVLESIRHNVFWRQFPQEYESKFRKLYDKQKWPVFDEIADEIKNLKGT